MEVELTNGEYSWLSMGNRIKWLKRSVGQSCLQETKGPVDQIGLKWKYVEAA